MQKSSSFKKTVLILLSAAFVALMPVMRAQAVFITPVLIVFQDKQVATKITVNNRGDTPRKVRLSWERRTMTEDGAMVKLEEGEEMPGYRPADPYLRFSPREFILQPRRYQKIRMIAMRPGDMAPGEYRSHILLEERPVKEVAENQVADASDAQGDQELQETPKTGPEGGAVKFGGQIVLQVNKSTPVFLLQGETNVDISIASAAIVSLEGKPALNVVVDNTSTRSIYAQMQLVCKGADGNADFENVFVLRLYPEAKHVENTHALKKLDTAGCGSMSVNAIAYKDFALDGQVIATASVQK